MDHTPAHGTAIPLSFVRSPRRRKADGLRYWATRAGFVTTIAAIVALVVKVIAWPWEPTTVAAATTVRLEARDAKLDERVSAVEKSIVRIEAKLEAVPAKTAAEVVGELVRTGALKR